MNFENIKGLITALQKGTDFSFSAKNDAGEDVTHKISTNAIEETLRDELFEMCKTRSSYEQHKWELFDLISETIDRKMPKELDKFFNGFTKVTQYGESDKPEITIKRDPRNKRARTFITKVSPAGTYEVFKLAKDQKFTVEMTAIGGACQIAFEDFLTGRVDWNEMLEVIQLGMEDRVYDEILATLEKVEASLPTANKKSTSDFDAAEFEKLLGVVGVYGSPVVFCTEVAARLITEGTDWASENEKVARRNVGYLTNYKGAKIVVLPQSFTDETNSVKVTPDHKLYIMPAGREAIFHVALQGATHIEEMKNYGDWSRELQTYKKFGVSAVIYNDIAIYEIEDLKV